MTDLGRAWLKRTMLAEVERRATMRVPHTTVDNLATSAVLKRDCPAELRTMSNQAVSANVRAVCEKLVQAGKFRAREDWVATRIARLYEPVRTP